LGYRGRFFLPGSLGFTLDAAVEEMSPKAVAYRADVTDSNACADPFGQSVGSLDIVFANAEFRSTSSKPPVNPSQRLITSLMDK
jgi:NAD(P)-dependent dehydrogenase (short-subunit alcohol dehydrogenase family)